MRLLIQRVKKAKVEVEGSTVGEIGHGLLVFIGLTHGDSAELFPKMFEKLINLRIFDDEKGIPNKSLLDEEGELLLVSQFTLYADAKKGRRPSYTNAMPPAEARALFQESVDFVRKLAPETKVETGEFGAMMEVSLINDGPVTIWLDSSIIFNK